MKLIKIIFIFIGIFSTLPAYNQISISPWVGYTYAKSEIKNLNNRNHNVYIQNKENTYSFGANISTPFLKKNKSFLISTGLNFSSNNVRASFNSVLEGINPRDSYISWENKYNQFNIPFLLYKTFYFTDTKTSNFSIFSGIGLGISYISRSKREGSLVPLSLDLVASDYGNLFFNDKISFIPTYIGGFDLAPFQNFKNLKIGFTAIINLKKSSTFQETGYFENVTKRLKDEALIAGSPIFHNFIISLKYDINFKIKKQSKIKKFEDDIDDY